jgi:hypothetical protein
LNYYWRYSGPNYQTAIGLLRSRYTYFVLLGLGLLLGASFCYEDYYLRDLSATFRKTTAVVQDVDVAVHSRTRYRTPTSFAPAVTFTFAAPDGRHTVTGYRLREGGMSEMDAARIADRFEPARAVDCWYDPADPQTAVLTTEPDRRHLGTLTVWAILLTGAGLAGWVVVDFVCKPAPAAPPLAPEAADPLNAALARPSSAITSALPPPRTQGH